MDFIVTDNCNIDKLKAEHRAEQGKSCPLWHGPFLHLHSWIKTEMNPYLCLGIGILALIGALIWTTLIYSKCHLKHYNPISTYTPYSMCLGLCEMYVMAVKE